MKFKDLKRYILLSNGNQIDQKYEKITEDDVIQKDNKLYIKYKDYVLDGNAHTYYGIIQAVYTCQKESTLKEHMFKLFDDGEIYFDAIKQCIASINAYCEYHIKRLDDLYKNKIERDKVSNYHFYKGMHHAMEELKHNMAWQLVWRNNKIEYFGQGGTLKKQKWYDTPFGYHKDEIYW